MSEIGARVRAAVLRKLELSEVELGTAQLIVVREDAHWNWKYFDSGSHFWGTVTVGSRPGGTCGFDVDLAPECMED